MNSTKPFLPRTGIVLAFNKSIALEWETILQNLSRLPEPGKLTPEQQRAILAIEAMDNSLLIEAVAGSGKTMVEKLGLKKLHARTGLRLLAKTCHSLGYSAWREKVGRPLSSFDGKMRQAAKDLGILENHHASADGIHPGFQALRLAEQAKTFGLVPGDRGQPLLPDEESTWQDFADNLGIDLDPRAIAFARQLLEESFRRATVGHKVKINGQVRHVWTVDFADMIYLPAVHSCYLDQFDFICGDEVQDWSALQRQLIRKALDPQGRLLAAGDPCQSIYAFRGADAESIPALKEEFALEVLPLTTNFRCARSIIEGAKTFDPRITAWDGAPEGKVTSAENPPIFALPEAVLCRNNAPLVRTALSCIAQGRAAYIAGREIGEQLANLVMTVSPEDEPLDAFLEKLDLFIEKKIAKKPSLRFTLEDQRSALEAICIAERARGLDSTSAILDTLDMLYPKSGERNPHAILFSTVHKAKGLEWPKVAILNRELFGRFAQSEADHTQERNLQLVATTRAKEHLMYISFPDNGGHINNPGINADID